MWDTWYKVHGLWKRFTQLALMKEVDQGLIYEQFKLFSPLYFKQLICVPFEFLFWLWFTSGSRGGGRTPSLFVMPQTLIFLIWNSILIEIWLKHAKKDILQLLTKSTPPVRSNPGSAIVAIDKSSCPQQCYTDKQVFQSKFDNRFNIYACIIKLQTAFVTRFVSWEPSLTRTPHINTSCAAGN